jgi:hypothetical protein
MKPDEKPLQPSLAVTAGAQHVTSRAVCQGGPSGLEVFNRSEGEEIPSRQPAWGIATPEVHADRNSLARIGDAPPVSIPNRY